MKKLAVVLMLFLVGCSSLGQYRKDNIALSENYLKDPTGKMMVFIDTINPEKYVLNSRELRCSESFMAPGIMGPHVDSYYARTPFVKIVPIDSIRQDGTKLSDIDKAKFQMAAPVYSLTCQSDGSGIEGKIYIDGKVVSSSVANIEYGVVSLNCNIPVLK